MLRIWAIEAMVLCIDDAKVPLSPEFEICELSCISRRILDSDYNMQFMHCNTWITLTHWGRDKMDTISQTTFWSAFSWMKMFEFRFKFHWSLFLKVQFNYIPALVWIMAWPRPGKSHYLKQWWFILQTHVCVIRPRWVNVNDSCGKLMIDVEA